MTEIEAIEKAQAEAAALWYEGEYIESSNLPIAIQQKTANFKPKTESGHADPFADDWNPPIKNTTGRLSAEDLNDPELMRELAQRDPKFKIEFDDVQKEEISIAFIAANPGYYASDKNHSRIVRFMGKQHLGLPNLSSDDGIDKLFAAGQWNVPNITQAFKALTKEGRMEVEPGTWKKLNKEELLAVVSDIRRGDYQGAVSSYLNASLGGHLESNFSTVRNFVSEFPELTSEAVWFVFDQAHAGELSVEELRAFRKHMSRYPLPTFQMLVAALPSWQAKRDLASFAAEESKAKAEPQPQQRELTPAELNRLSTEEIDRLIIEERLKLR